MRQFIEIVTESLSIEARRQLELQREAQGYHGNCHLPSDPWGHNADQYVWREEDHYPIANCKEMSPTQWRKWMKDEIRDKRLDGDGGYYDDLMDPADEIREPIFVVEYEGCAYVWDGYHRVGSSYCVGRPTVPAIVGTPHK